MIGRFKGISFPRRRLIPAAMKRARYGSATELKRSRFTVETCAESKRCVDMRPKILALIAPRGVLVGRVVIDTARRPALA